MGGISIWCMHFISNRAIDLADGQADLQVAYSSGFTTISFFVPIIVLLAAFVAVGTNNRVSWWRVCAGGLLCGTAVCGMHYLGNASIANYVCVYRPAYVIGSAIIAVVASIVALAMFFVFRAAWASSWWKLAISAVILAGAVSGMHWCAAVATQYRLINSKPEGNGPSRTATVIVVICLVTIFDKSGRILVTTDGLIPSTLVTDSFLEKHSKEGFNIGHPLFHWMFHASRNWGGISGLIGGMRHHLAVLPHSGRERDGRHGIRLIDERGEMIGDYDVIFRELFCLAAASLADRLRDNITSAGVLWDEILPTGALGKRSRSQLQQNSSWDTSSDHGSLSENLGADVEKGINLWEQEYAGGSLMFLVRRIESDRDAERYVSAGYRFAETQQVSCIIRTSMQIKSAGFDQKLRDMVSYTTRQKNTHAGVQLGFFAIRARPNSLGFEIMVRKGARDMLPSMSLPMSKLRDWHMEFLRRFENLTVSELLRALTEEDFSSQSPKEGEFAGQLVEVIEGLREWTQETLFNEATLTSTVVELPSMGDYSSKRSTMITMRLMHQIPAKFGHEFTRGVLEEFGPIIKKSAARAQEPRKNGAGLLSKLWRSGSSSASTGSNSASSKANGGRRGSSPDSVRTGSTINLCAPSNVDRTHSIDSGDDSMYASRNDSSSAPPSYGGIMVFREIKIDVEEDSKTSTGAHLMSIKSHDTIVVEPASSRMSSMGAGIEMQPIGHLGNNVHVGQTDRGMAPADLTHMVSFVDVLFSECMEGRQ
ncbi:hypothetical protein BGZ61DRAFT_539517 [Ilyonectria robusta]|uniref:uncharacterized protein n=1 Tax=Ilyonectria robusta TaxID=1079257 RepID=UPI001E8D409D|nr:uncharacterized protein BGZ61DRAFT_539517 [Ilyonectria robusta]KAH8661704.1 hypothetical protein BGZ61DRAFT_539517 [Ilyonectria robusta]